LLIFQKPLEAKALDFSKLIFIPGAAQKFARILATTLTLDGLALVKSNTSSLLLA